MNATTILVLVALGLLFLVAVLVGARKDAQEAANEEQARRNAVADEQAMARAVITGEEREALLAGGGDPNEALR